MAGADFDLLGDAAGSLGSGIGAFFSASGYDAEQAAYGTAAAIAASNAELSAKNIGLVRENTAIQDRAIGAEIKQNQIIARQQAVQERVQKMQMLRKSYQVMGATSAALSASGLATAGGNAHDLLRSNQQQLALESALQTSNSRADQEVTRLKGEALETTREINAKQSEISVVNAELQQKSFLQQSAAYLGESAAAGAAATASRAKGGSDIFKTVLGVGKFIAGLFL